MRLRPTVVPEAFVVDAGGRLCYRGRIDDRFVAVGKPRTKVTHHELRDAIAALHTGGRAPESQPAVGCIFEAWTAAVPESVTYTRDIEPLLRANCVECHVPGGIGPFPLDSYSSAKRRARMVAAVCEERVMPPWRAARSGRFRDERILSERQIALFRAWADAGAPKGEADAALPALDRRATKWRLGKPDLVLKMPRPFEIPAEGNDIYRYFVLPPKFPKDVVVTAMDFVPGDPTVVHHMNSFVDYSGRARKKDAEDEAPGFSVFGDGGFFDYSGADESGTIAVGGWTPGSDPYSLPPGYGIALERGGEVVIEVHYHLTGKATRDQSEIGFYFAKKPVSKYVDGMVIGTQELDIPANSGDYGRHSFMEVPADLVLTDITPHMHQLGKSLRATLIRPDGTFEPLITIRDWDLRWQNIYTFRQPLRVPKGSRIDVWFSYDNTEDNPDNPSSPPKRVRWGWGTDEEMAELWMGFVPDRPGDAEKIRAAAEASWYR